MSGHQDGVWEILSVFMCCIGVAPWAKTFFVFFVYIMLFLLYPGIFFWERDGRLARCVVFVSLKSKKAGWKVHGYEVAGGVCIQMVEVML